MDLLKVIKESLDKVRATDITVYDLRGISPLADYTVVATIDVIRQANAVIEYLEEAAAKEGFRIRGVEGKDSTWILVDLSDVILHVFTKDERSNYDLDRLYMNVPKINMD